MIIENFFPEEHVVFVKNTEKQLVIRELISELEALKKISNAERYYAQIMHRESLENTGIGNGLAIPHARTETSNKLVSILGIAPEGVEYLSIDKIPVKYILLNIFPTSMSTNYLYLVGMIARIFSNNEKRILLDKADSPEKIYSFLKNESNAYFNTISSDNEDSGYDNEDLTGVPPYNLELLIKLDRLYELLDKDVTSVIIKTKIDEIKKLINNKSLTYYERMRKKCRTPFAVLDKNSCTGCHMGLAPVYVSQIKEENKIPLCNHCGRFLIML